MGKDKWAVLGILLILGFLVYRQFFQSSPVEPVYEKWSQAVEIQDCTTLNAMAEGSAKDWVQNFCSQPEAAPSSPQGSADQTADLNLKVSPTEKALYVLRDVKSQTQNPDGTITLVSKETHMPIPGSLKKPVPPRMVTLTLKQEGDAWKVVNYQSQDIPQ